MASIADVAALAGVSATTVSHALSGKRHVSEPVRARVFDAMRELRYSPSRTAQSLASGRTHILGLIVPDIVNEFFAELTRGVELAAVECGYNVILCTTGFDREREAHYLSMIRSRAVDGLVYAAGAPPSTSELGRILGTLPLVLVDESVPGSSAPTFVSDNAHGGLLAAHHLLELGHRRAIVLAAEGELVSSADRVRGFVDAWTRAGAPAPAVARGAFTAEGGARAVSAHVAEIARGEATAVFAANDLMALGAMDVLERAGVRIPADASLIGFDDITAGRYVKPRLTTIRQDVGELGSRAVSALVALLDGDGREGGDAEAPSSLAPQKLPVTLTVRGSTAAVPAR